MEEFTFDNNKNLLLTFFTYAVEVTISIVLFMCICIVCGQPLGESQTRQTIILNGILYLASISSGGVILHKRNTRKFQILLLVVRNVIVYAVASMTLLSLGDFYRLPLGPTLAYYMLLAVMSAVFRNVLRQAVKSYRTDSRHVHHVILVGSNANNISLFHEMVSSSSYGYAVDGYFDFAPNAEFKGVCEYLGTPPDVLSYLRTHKDVHELYCCLTSDHQETIVDIIHYCVNHLVHFYSVPNVSNYLHHRMYLNILGKVPYLSMFRDPLTRMDRRIVKRTFDIVFSGLFLCTLYPFILLAVTIITKMTMPGPVYFRQKRSGINGEEFYCLKFRSMRINDDADSLQATRHDPRVTKWGEIMRRTNIDELPQFINVFKGDMSVVGPRPHMLKHTEEYSQLIDKYMVRHFIKPGITGWSQVTGFRGETRELSQMEGRVMGDIWYIEHWSIWLDLFIIYKTIVNAFSGDSQAY